MSETTNLHIYPSTIVNESRIFRQTEAVSDAQLFDRVIVCGQQADGLDADEAIDERRSIERLGSYASQRPSSVFGRILEQLTWSMAVYRRSRRRSVRVVNAHSVAVLPVSHAIARRHGAALIYDTHELETETSTSSGIQGWVFRLIEKLYVPRCDAVFVVNESIAEWYGKEYPNARVVSVRNTPSRTEAPQPVDFREMLGIPESSRIYVHVGNIAPHRHVTDILESFVARESSGDHVVFVGDGALADVVGSYANSHCNIHHFGSVPASAVVDTVAGADVGFCLIEANCLSYSLSLPNKALEYSMAGIPFFYTDLIEVDRLIGGESSFWKVTPATKSLIEALASVSDHTLEEGRKMIAQVVSPDWDTESGRMLAEYRRILETV